jgi:hypothetical protein
VTIESASLWHGSNHAEAIQDQVLDHHQQLTQDFVAATIQTEIVEKFNLTASALKFD